MSPGVGTAIRTGLDLGTKSTSDIEGWGNLESTVRNFIAALSQMGLFGGNTVNAGSSKKVGTSGSG